MQRIVTSYKLMLDFYGMQLENEVTGLISRSSKYATQYRNLCSTSFCPDLPDNASCRAPYAVSKSHLCDWLLRLPLLFVPSTGSSHNNLRISRILKCLSELGHEYLNYGFLLHILNEQSEHGHLNTSIIRSSMDRWWANCVRRQPERDWINEKIARARDKDDDEPFVFTREMYEAAINNWNNEGRF